MVRARYALGVIVGLVLLWTLRSGPRFHDAEDGTRIAGSPWIVRFHAAPTAIGRGLAADLQNIDDGRRVPLIPAGADTHTLAIATLTVHSRRYLVTRLESQGSGNWLYYEVYRLTPSGLRELMPDGVTACWDPQLDGETLVFSVTEDPYHCHLLPLVWGTRISDRVALEDN
jgi:hypothetical protein